MNGQSTKRHILMKDHLFVKHVIEDFELMSRFVFWNCFFFGLLLFLRFFLLFFCYFLWVLFDCVYSQTMFGCVVTFFNRFFFSVLLFQVCHFIKFVRTKPTQKQLANVTSHWLVFCVHCMLDGIVRCAFYSKAKPQCFFFCCRSCGLSNGWFASFLFLYICVKWNENTRKHTEF